MRRLLACLLLAGSILATGCATNQDTEKTNQSAIPWSRPADWEGQVPGVGRR